VDLQVDLPPLKIQSLGLNLPVNLGLNLPANLGLNLPVNLGLNLPVNLGLNLPVNLGLNLPVKIQRLPVDFQVDLPPLKIQSLGLDLPLYALHIRLLNDLSNATQIGKDAHEQSIRRMTINSDFAKDLSDMNVPNCSR